MLESERAGSESIGAVLMVAVVVLAVALLSGVLFAAQSSGDDPPNAALAAHVDGANVSVHHRGGATVSLDSLTVMVRADGDETRFRPAAANVTAGDADDRFEPGERWERAHGAPVAVGDRVQVLVVHEPTNAVVLDAERRVE